MYIIYLYIYLFTTQCPAYIKRTISGRMEDSWSKPYEVFPPPSVGKSSFFFIWRTMVVRYKYLYFIPNCIVEKNNNIGDNPMYFSKFQI